METFAGNDQAERDLRAAGWKAAYAAIFVEEGFALDEQEMAPPDALFVAAYLSIYEGAEDANGAFEDYYSGLEDQNPNVEFLSSPELGDEARGARGTWPEEEGGQPWLVYSWRIGNLFAHLSIQGQITSDDALNIAAKMEGRARELD